MLCSAVVIASLNYVRESTPLRRGQWASTSRPQRYGEVERLPRNAEVYLQ